MNYRYTLLDPTKNYTLLVDTPVAPKRQPAVAAALMQKEPLAEQVGFLTETGDGSVRLRMAGGEFCGNAAMSAAVLCAAASGRIRAEIPVHFSDVDITIPVHVYKNTESDWSGTVYMPKPESVQTVALSSGGKLPVVSFAGISHVILQTHAEKKTLEKLAPIWCRELHAQAVGIMQFDAASGRLVPLVYVPSADTLFWENSCASGTAAVGCFLYAQQQKPFQAAFDEPGGTLRVAVDGCGVLCLTGYVRIMQQTVCALECAAE